MAVLIIVTASIALVKNRASLSSLDSDSRWVCCILIANLSLVFFYFSIGRDSIEVLIDPGKMIFMIPIVLGVLTIGLRPDRLILGLALGMCGAACIVGYQQQVMGVERPAVSYNPNVFSEVALVSGAVLLSCIGLFPGWKKMLPGLGALAAIYCVILSQSRGTWLALFPMGLIAGLVYIKFRHLADFRKAGPSRKKFAVYLVVLLLLATGLGYQFGDGMVKRVTTAAENYSIYKADRTQFSSLAIRLELWYSTWLSFKEAPITGIGSDNRIEYLAELESAGKIHLGSYPWRHAHSDYLDRLQRQGLPAMILLIGFYGILFRIFWRGLKTDNNEQFSIALGGLMTVTCYATFSLTEVPFWDSLMTVYFVVLVSILLGVLRRSQLKREQAGR